MKYLTAVLLFKCVAIWLCNISLKYQSIKKNYIVLKKNPSRSFFEFLYTF